ncbi:sugar ABC transporter ATP-binding protein [Microbacterium terregens]|uniref:Sugar ABC transporter ATP-binding protein n=1 Tax=Microbacterium terregens TaxID=69363 RepID=A0ABV5T2R8_9MICO
MSKTFPGQVALDAASLTVAPGEVHALLGQNGSGKSTLIKILAGYHQPDPGAVAARDGVEFHLGSAAAAHAAGIRFIHQDLGLIPELSVTDNLALGGRYRGWGWVDDRRETAAAQGLLDQWGVEIDASALLGSLGQADRTMVAIVRAVRDGLERAGILVLDEPSATLPPHEFEHLSRLVRDVRDRGGSVVYVTHRLGEVFQLADTVTVLRDGRVIGSRPVAGMDHDDLVTMIIGRTLENVHSVPAEPGDGAMLMAEEISGDAVTSLTLQLREREVVGIAGLTGSGRESVADLIFGTRERLSGTVRVEGRDVRAGRPAESIAHGMALLPADRKAVGSIPALTVRENVTLPAIPARRGGWLSIRAERRDVREWLDRLSVVPRDPERALANLSGGNQQRALITRWLRCESKVFLMDEPTQGVDIGAKVEIYRAIRDAASGGAGILVVSTDNDELVAICDRVIVMRDGETAATLSGGHLTSEAILELSMDRTDLKDTGS